MKNGFWSASLAPLRYRFSDSGINEYCVYKMEIKILKVEARAGEVRVGIGKLEPGTAQSATVGLLYILSWRNAKQACAFGNLF